MKPGQAKILSGTSSLRKLRVRATPTKLKQGRHADYQDTVRHLHDYFELCFSDPTYRYTRDGSVNYLISVFYSTGLPLNENALLIKPLRDNDTGFREVLGRWQKRKVKECFINWMEFSEMPPFFQIDQRAIYLFVKNKFGASVESLRQEWTPLREVLTPDIRNLLQQLSEGFLELQEHVNDAPSSTRVAVVQMQDTFKQLIEKLQRD